MWAEQSARETRTCDEVQEGYNEEKLHLIMRSGQGQAGKYAHKWVVGVWVGRRWGIAVNIIVETGRVTYARTIHRKPEDARWCKERVQNVTALPWEASHDPISHPLTDHSPEERDQLSQEPSHGIDQRIYHATCSSMGIPEVASHVN